MDQDLLPLRLVGWFFTIVPLAAVVGGALLLGLLQKRGRLSERYQKKYTAWNDLLLLVVWSMGFVGGLGLLNRRPWGASLLEYFCWMMILIITVNALTRMKMLREGQARARRAEPMNWVAAVAAAMIAVSPILAMFGATIYTLHSDAVRQALIL